MKTEDKATRARNLAYKKPLVKNLNFEYIRNEMYDITEACDEVRYFVEEDENILYSVLGDEDEAYEFKMLFSSLAYDAERLSDAIYNDYELPEIFDDWFCAMHSGEDFGGYLGYDSYEDDYVKLEYEDFVETDAGKRICKKTKPDILNGARMCFKILVSWLSIRNRYNDLQCAFDIIRDKNTSYLQMIRDINEAYEKCVSAQWYDEDKIKEFERLVLVLPQEAWLQ